MDQNLNQLASSKHCRHTNISIIIVKLKCGMQCCRELLVAALCECFMRDRPLNDDRTIFGSSRERIGREIVSCYFSFLATITVGLGGVYHDALLVIINFTISIGQIGMWENMYWTYNMVGWDSLLLHDNVKSRLRIERFPTSIIAAQR